MGFYCVLLLGLLALNGCSRAPLLEPRPPAGGKAHSSVGPHSVQTSAAAAQDNAYARIYRSPKTGEHHGAVASVNPIATQAGMDAFANGGNAIDAALATAFTLGVVDSHNSGIGGGCFILMRLADGRVLAIDGREMAPGLATENMFVVDGEVQKRWSRSGALAVGIPGSVAAFEKAQQEGGRLSFKEVLLPAAQIAERGFAVDKTMALRLKRSAPTLAEFPQSAAIFLDAKQQPLVQGSQLRQPDLANSYRSLAAEGAAWFYRGEFARATAAWMAANKGLVTAEDFARYKVILRTPIKSQFGAYTIFGFPPPSSGGVHVAQLLNLFDILGVANTGDAEAYHLIAESMKLAFADRAHWLGDADFVPVPRGLTSREYAAALAAKVNPARAARGVTFNTPPRAAEDVFNKHTTHIAAADAQGNWVAITATLNTSFGSKVVVPGTGVLLNNQMDDFTSRPGVANAFKLVGSKANHIAPGKRPLSSMSPTLVFKDGRPIMTLGAAGGPTIISQVAQASVRVLGNGDDLHSAVSHPRVHHQWSPNRLYVEPAITDEIKQQLVAKGHSLKTLGSFGGTQAISWDGKVFTAVAEPRIIKRNAQPD